MIDSEIERYNTLELEDLRLLMEEYNRDIFESKQQDLKDPFSYEKESFDLSGWGFEDNMMGCIELPAIDIKLPVYLGASMESMKKGAVHLSNTSLFIGGENTNSVIAAHRGFYGARMFRNIHKLKIGDEIFITSFWDTLTYEVIEIKIIYPNDIHEILVQEGRDLVTLISCHPLTENYQRYVVVCERRP